MTQDQAQALVKLASVLDEPQVVEQLKKLSSHPLECRRFFDARFTPEVSIALLECAGCRQHFHKKFLNAPLWLLSREAAEQATNSRLAAWRATYLRERFPQAKSLTEVGTGLGGDSVFFAQHFDLHGYEQDTARATLAKANIQRLNTNSVSALIKAQAAPIASLEGDLLFCDPARRDRRRLYNPEDWDPPLSSLLDHSAFQTTALKVAPGLDLKLLPTTAEVHFLSFGGNLKEAMLLDGMTLNSSSSRHAWLWPEEALAPLHRHGFPHSILPSRPPVSGDFLHQPDPSLIRSGLLKDLADELSAHLVHPQIAYLCGPRPCPHPWATSFQAHEIMPLNWKRLNTAILASSWGDIEFLTRGVPFTLQDILDRTKAARKRLKARGGPRGSVLIWRDTQGYQVALTCRHPSPTLKTS